MSRRILALLAAAALTLTACAGGGDSDGGQDSAGTVSDDEAAVDRGSTDSGEAGGGATEQAYAPEEQVGDGDAGGGFAQVSLGAPIGRKIIRDADLELAVDDADEAVRRITGIAESSGGFVSSAELRNDDEHGLLGTLSLRVPTERMSATLGAIEEVAAEVRSRSIGTQDVTEQYADIEAQLRNLRALETQLLDLLAEIREKSSSANEVLTVFERIRQVRAEIEQLEGRKQLLDDLVGLATIDVRLVPSDDAAPLVEAGGWDPGGVVSDALRATVGVLQSVANATIWVALTVLPVLAILALPLVAAAYGYRRYRRRDGEAQPTAG